MRRRCCCDEGEPIACADWSTNSSGITSYDIDVVAEAGDTNACDNCGDVSGLFNLADTVGPSCFGETNDWAYEFSPTVELTNCTGALSAYFQYWQINSICPLFTTNLRIWVNAVYDDGTCVAFFERNITMPATLATINSGTLTPIGGSFNGCKPTSCTYTINY